MFSTREKAHSGTGGFPPLSCLNDILYQQPVLSNDEQPPGRIDEK